MIVHIIANAAKIEENIPYIQSVVEAIHDQGAVLATDWVSAAQRRVDKGIEWDISNFDWEQFHQENLDSISRADVVVADATNYKFPDGLYTSFALQQKKPVLLVTRNNIEDCLLAGLKHKLLTVLPYTTREDIYDMVNKFIKTNTIATKDLRFNFFIDRQIYSYLREASYETGKNKSEIIRELIEAEIDERERTSQ